MNKPRIHIFEGARTMGKSTLTHSLRQQIEGSTLINFTGFKQDGNEGLSKAYHYYSNWMDFFEKLNYDYTFICDRFFFSEMVYSSLYKSYDFVELYEYLLERLAALGDVHVYQLMTDSRTVAERLNRDKVGLFGSISDDVERIMAQQAEYVKLFGEKKFTESGVTYHPVFAGFGKDQLRDYVLKLMGEQ